MISVYEITKKIEELRELMYQLMNEKTLLTDPDLVALSQEIDKLLNKYNELIKKKK